VEYRLLQHAHFPAALQDAAAVYLHIVQNYQDIKYRIVLIGDSAGGNLALALTRWIRDEGMLRMPHGLLLLSVSHVLGDYHSILHTIHSHRVIHRMPLMKCCPCGNLDRIIKLITSLIHPS
jgi:acetyl esterase/lipase